MVEVSSAAAANPCEQSEACLVVSGGPGGDKIFRSGQLPDTDQTAQTYYFCCSSNGGLSSDELPPALTIHQLLRDAGIDPDAVSFTTAQTTNDGIVSVLDGADHELADDQTVPFRYPDGYRYPVVWSSAGQIFYVRPMRDASDRNNREFLNASAGQELHIVAHTTGTLFTPTLSVDDTSIAAKDTATFSVAGTGSHGTATYHWDFGDGTKVDTSQPQDRHTYKTAGTWSASVSVTTSDDSYGQSNPVIIDVGPAATPTKAAPSTAGRGRGATDNPTVGPATGTGVQAGGNPSAASPTARGAAQNPTSTSTVTSTATRSATGSPTSSDAPRAFAGVQVAGQVLGAAALSAVAPADSSTSVAAPDPAARSASSAGQLGAGAITAVILAVLIGGGAAFERRQARRGAGGRHL